MGEATGDVFSTGRALPTTSRCPLCHPCLESRQRVQGVSRSPVPEAAGRAEGSAFLEDPDGFGAYAVVLHGGRGLLRS